MGGHTGKNTAMLMYKNIISFSFPFTTWNVWNSRVRERVKNTAEMYSQGKIRIFSEPLLLGFGKGPPQGTKLSFFSLIYFCKAHQGHPKAPNYLLSTQFSTFASLVRVVSSHWIILDSSCFSTFMSHISSWAVWCKASI